MPPTQHDPQSQLRYFIRLLAALCLQGDGEITIDQKYLRQIDADGSRQALVEETDCAGDCLVLRYGSKHSAMYPVEPLSQPQTQPSQSPKSLSIPSPVSSPTAKPRLPMSIEQIAEAERKLRQMRIAAQMKAEREGARETMPTDEGWLENLTRPPRS